MYLVFCLFFFFFFFFFFFWKNVKDMRINEESEDWDLSIMQAKRKDTAETRMNVRAGFVCHAGGILYYSKWPTILVLETFQGPQFHIVR